MSKKILTLVVAASLGLAFAGPPSAAAAVPEMSFGKANPTFVSTGGTSLLTLGALSVDCTSVISAGQWTTGEANIGSTGTVQIAFKGCILSNGFACTSPGAAKGEVKSEELVFHLAYIKGFSTTVGVLFTNNATTGRFSTTTCGNITGNGLIAHLGNQKCGESKKTATLTFESIASGVPRYQEIEGSETKYHWLYGTNEASADTLTTTETEVSGQLTCT